MRRNTWAQKASGSRADVLPLHYSHFPPALPSCAHICVHCRICVYFLTGVTSHSVRGGGLWEVLGKPAVFPAPAFPPELTLTPPVSPSPSLLHQA